MEGRFASTKDEDKEMSVDTRQGFKTNTGRILDSVE